jgi:hypothetical protein
MNECNDRFSALPDEFSAVSRGELVQVEGGGFWGRLAEAVGRLAEGVGVVTGSPLLIVAGGAMY